MKKALLVLGGSLDQLFMIRTAQAMSIETVVVDGNPNAPGLTLANYAEPINFSLVDKVIEYVTALKNKGVNVGGVSTMGSEVPHIIAKIAKHFNWVGPSEETGFLATNKDAMKLCFQRNSIPIPNFSIVSNAVDIQTNWRKWDCKKVVIKPTDRAGSRGVRVVEKVEHAHEALQYAKSYSNNGRILLEEFIDGPQISTESVVFGSVCVTPGFADRVYDDLQSFHPNIMENGGWVPSAVDDSTKTIITKMVEMAARALGINKGVAKGDVVICPKRGPMMIEMAARLSGGDFSESLVPLGFGINYIETVIDIAIGNKPDFDKLIPKRTMAVANRYFFPPIGRLQEIVGVQEAMKYPQVVKMEFNYKSGQEIPLITNHSQRAGVFVVVDKNRGSAQKIIDKLYDTIKFKIGGKIYGCNPKYYGTYIK